MTRHRHTLSIPWAPIVLATLGVFAFVLWASPVRALELFDGVGLVTLKDGWEALTPVQKLGELARGYRLQDSLFWVALGCLTLAAAMTWKRLKT